MNRRKCEINERMKRRQARQMSKLPNLLSVLLAWLRDFRRAFEEAFLPARLSAAAEWMRTATSDLIQGLIWGLELSREEYWLMQRALSGDLLRADEAASLRRHA